MMTVILGGSGSGKSAYAEETAAALAGTMPKYYLATMQALGEEGQKKVERHRKLRAGKGFFTLEQQVRIQEAAAQMAQGEKTALLECISNLAANEMFEEGNTGSTAEEVSSRILKGIRELNRHLTHLVIVSNTVSEDGILYEEGTMEYLQALGRINQGLAVMADTVVEVVVGIPLVLKGKAVRG